MEAIEAEADHFMASKNGFRCQKTMVLEADLSVFLIHDLLTWQVVSILHKLIYLVNTGMEVIEAEADPFLKQ